MDAITVMLERAVEHYPASVNVEDKKEDVANTTLSASGPLQDCEFGMVVLLVNDWLGDAPFESFGEKFEWALTTLVDNTLTRLLKPNLRNEGGGGGDHRAFFTGEPYTQHSRGKKYSANLDAAMIVLAFLMLALKRFDEVLSKRAVPPPLNDVALPEWVKTQRDAAVLVIIEGLKYARECRVAPDGRFQGFTCDPDSNRARPADGSLEDDADRLFFTWTACETINDIIDWRGKYLEPMSGLLPAEAVAEMGGLIDELQKTLHQASEWCAQVFLTKFESFDPEVSGELVAAVNALGEEGVPGVEQQRDINIMEDVVQHVYHLSQYAAIRSLVPKAVTLSEVGTISDKLDVLVKQILGSGLDDALHPKLYITLTRQYDLGKSNPDPYVDDAWYPLVVRSLSGLLSRTLDDIGASFPKQQVLNLTATFQRSLQEHFRSLIKRRPEGGAGGADGKLWSFATGKPYVLYATQRTIFALMKYEEFLRAVYKFQQEPDEPEEQTQEDLSLVLARKMAETHIRPLIDQMLKYVPRDGNGAYLLPVAAPQQVPLPGEPWAAAAVCKWLADFTRDFERAKVAGNVSQRASELIRIRKYAESYEPSPNLPERLRRPVEEHLETLKAKYEDIRNFDGVMPKLAELPGWEDGKLTPVLFDYLFRSYLNSPGVSFEHLFEKESLPALWKLIQEAKSAQESISGLDKTATVS
ncbi:MAG TPA: hypothetical protein VGP08_15505 [Pyrinomonadaceae bacterium]|nr:hypothetical protein [Pyrinomonadaceae bacterium]